MIRPVRDRRRRSELDEWLTRLADGMRGGDFERVTTATTAFLVCRG